MIYQLKLHILSSYEKKKKKKKVTNLVILDEMLKSSSKKYDEMINLLKCGFGFMFSNPRLHF